MPMRSYLRVLMMLACVRGGPVALHAQTATREQLAAAKTVTCVFTVYATGTWKNGEAEGALKTGKLSVQFTEINTDEGSARMASGFGIYDIIVRLASGSLHFIQAYRDGPLYTTTIFDKESRDGRLKAVHTRHEYTDIALPGFTSKPEQYYGDCAVGP
jgi:hypothetical protein